MKTFKEYGLPPSAAKGAKAHTRPLPKKKYDYTKDADAYRKASRGENKEEQTVFAPFKVKPVKTKVDLKGLKKAVKFYDKPMKKEAVDADDKGEYDYEGEMAKNQLNTMIDAATELKGMLGDDDNLPEWVQSKITKATDYIDSVRDYMKSKAES